MFPLVRTFLSAVFSFVFIRLLKHLKLNELLRFHWNLLPGDLSFYKPLCFLMSILQHKDLFLSTYILKFYLLIIFYFILFKYSDILSLIIYSREQRRRSKIPQLCCAASLMPYIFHVQKLESFMHQLPNIGIIAVLTVYIQDMLTVTEH